MARVANKNTRATWSLQYQQQQRFLAAIGLGYGTAVSTGGDLAAAAAARHAPLDDNGVRQLLQKCKVAA